VGAASENHRQTVRQERPILIHTTSAALLSLGTFHPSIIKTSWPAGVSAAGATFDYNFRLWRTRGMGQPVE
jgi:hypothetical protein